VNIQRQASCLGLFVLLVTGWLPYASAADLDPSPESKITGATQTKSSARGRMSFAVIIGNNKSLGARRPDLHYADDDAARYFEILQTLAPGRVSLLAEFDRDTERLFPNTQKHAAAPTRTTLDWAGQQVAQQVREAERAGYETELYFVFAGHGDVAKGEGFVELADARFTSRDLEAWLRGIPFTRAHVILDSCNSFFMLGVRKPGGRHFATSEDAARALSSRLPNVGVFLSTSAEGEAFEWSEIQSGIFSHVVRSGLLGAADANGDGQVSYLELAAFVDTATDDVRNPNMRPHVFARGPGAADSAPIVRLGAMTEVRRFELGDASSLRIRLRDSHGLPLLDAHGESNIPLQLTLPEAWALGATVERTERGATSGPAALTLYAVPDPPGTVTLAALQNLPPQSAVRGPAETFQTLFIQPFGPQALASYVATRGATPPPVYGVSKEDAQRMEFVLDEIAKVEHTNRVTTAIGTLGAGALLGLGGVQVLQFDRSMSRQEKRRPRAIGGSLVGMSAAFLFGSIQTMASLSDGEEAAAQFRRAVRTGGDPAQAFADADKRLQKMVAERRSERRAGVIFGSAFMVSSTTWLIWSEIATDELDKRRDRRLLAGGGLVMGAMILADALIADTPGETLTKIWRDDPSLNQYQPALNLSPEGATLTVSGTWDE